MLKLAFIGCGNNGMSHAKILKKNPAVKLMAAVDTSGKRLNIIKELAPGIHCYSDYQEMLAKEKLDAVCISSPHVYHYEHDSIQNHKPAMFSPEDALKTHQVVFAIEASEKQHKKIDL